MNPITSQFGNSGIQILKYSPDNPPLRPSHYNDEFNDGIISRWMTPPSYDDAFSLSQTSGAVHLSESIFPGYLLMQGNMFSGSDYLFYKDFPVAVTQPFTVVIKVSMGAFIGVNDRTFGMVLQGQTNAYYYQFRAGRNSSAGAFRIVYNNGGGAAAGTETQQGYTGLLYMMLTHDGSKNISSYVSGDGLGWGCVELNRNLSGLTGFTKVAFITTSAGAGNPDGICAIDFFRYFSTANQFKIGS